MIYREHAPSVALARHVECYWTLSNRPGDPGGGGPRRVVPDGCIDVLFDLSTARGRFIGTMTRVLITEPSGAIDLLGVRFRPAGVRPFFGPRAEEITDQSIALELEWRNGAELAERLAAAATTELRIAVLEGELLTRSSRREIDPIAEASARIIRERGGNIEIRELAGTLRTSPRQLERKFASEIGVSPKKFARIMRIQRVLAVAPELARGQWAEAALELGFSDQAHLIREMRALANITPRDNRSSALRR